MKKIKFPSAQSVLLLIAAFVALLTWCIPSGQYDRLAYNKDDNSFVKTSIDNSITLEASQKTFVAVVQRIHQLKDPAKFRGWLYRIATNYCHEGGRENKKARQSVTDDFETFVFSSNIIIEASIEIFCDKPIYLL